MAAPTAPMVLPQQHREGPANSPQQSGPLTPGPLKGVGWPVWEKLAFWPCSSPSWDVRAPGLSLPCPCPACPSQDTPTGTHTHGGGGGRSEVARHPPGFRVPQDVGVCRERGLTALDPGSGGSGPSVHRTSGPHCRGPLSFSVQQPGFQHPCHTGPALQDLGVPEPLLTGPRRVTRSEPCGGHLTGAVESRGERAGSLGSCSHVKPILYPGTFSPPPLSEFSPRNQGLVPMCPRAPHSLSRVPAWPEQRPQAGVA